MRHIALASVLLLAGCTSLKLARPERLAGTDLSLPEDWQSTSTGHVGNVSLGWLPTFEDPELEELVAEALAHNQNLAIAAARLRIAKESTVFARAARLPSLAAGSSASLTGLRAQDRNGDLQPWERAEDYALSMNLSWEIDLWGRLRNLHQAAREDYQAAWADYRAARLSLAANAAKAWFNLITARQQVELARQTLASFQANFRITERNYKGGDTAASALDVMFGRNNVAQAERSLISRRLLLNEAERALEVLLGRYPSAAVEGRESLPALAAEVPAGLPSDLLMRRPDLVAAAADLRASAHRADAARKDLLPNIVLTSRVSTASDQLAELLSDPRSTLWNVAGSLSQPIYRGGFLRARARQTVAQNQAASMAFAGLALRAFQEVESALNTEHSLAAQEQFLEIELAQANLAEAQASREYSEGTGGILAVLEAQRRAVNARNAMIALRNQRLQNRIDLHLALGGDFAPSLEHDPMTAQLNQSPRLSRPAPLHTPR